MADENIQSLGVNLEITDGDRFAENLNAAAEAMDTFDASAQKVIDHATALSSAFDKIGTGFTGLREALAGKIDLAGVTTQINAALNAVNQAKNSAVTATVSHAPAGLTGEASFSQTDLGGTSKKVAADVEQATSAINTAMDEMAQNTQTQVDTTKSVLREMAAEADKVGAQVASSFKSSFDVVVANHLRTLERNQIARRNVVRQATITPEEMTGAKETISGQDTAELSRYTQIVENAQKRIKALRADLEATNPENERYGQILSDIADREKLATNELRLLSTESGTYTDHLKEQIRLMSDINKENVGARSNLPRTSGDNLDAGSKSIIFNIGERIRKTQEAAQATQAEAEAEQLAASQMVEIQNILQETTGKSVDYRKAKLRELLEETIASTREIMNAANQATQAQSQASAEQERVAAVQDRLVAQAKEQARVRMEAINKGALDAFSSQALKAQAQAALEAELGVIENEGKKTLQNFSEEALRSYRQLRTTLQADTRELQAQVKQDSIFTGGGLAQVAARKGTDRVLSMSFDEVSALKMREALASDNELVRTIYQGWARVVAVVADVRYYVESFSRALQGVKSIIDSSILAPFRLITAPINFVIGLLEKAQRLVGKNGEDLSTIGKGASTLFGKTQTTPNAAPTTGPPTTVAPEIIPVKADTVQAKAAIKEVDEVIKQTVAPKTAEIKANTTQAIVNLTSLKTTATQTDAAVKATEEQLTTLITKEKEMKGGDPLGKTSAKELTEIAAQIQAVATELGNLRSAQEKIRAAASEADQAMRKEAGGATELASSLKTIDKDAEAATSKLSGLTSSLSGGFVEGIGAGISHAITSSIIFGVQNAIFSLGSTIRQFVSEAMTSVENREKEIMGITSLMQKEIANTKGYENLGQAADEAKEKAKGLYEWVEKLAIVSPFSKEDLVGTFQEAMAFDFTARNAQTLTQAVTDFATVSHRGADSAKTIVEALGKIKNTGQVTKEELVRMTEAGFSAIPILAKGFKMDPGNFLEAVTKRSVDAKKAIEILVTSLQKDYGGAAAKSGGTVQGLINSLGDLKAKMLDLSVTPLLESIVKPFLGFLATAGQTKEVTAYFEALGQKIKTVGENIIRYLAAGFYIIQGALAAIPAPLKEFWDLWGKVGYAAMAAGAALLILPPIIAGIGAVIGFFLSPLSLVEAAIALLWMSWRHNFLGIRDITDQVVTEIVDLWNQGINGGFAAALDYLGGWYDSFVGILETIVGAVETTFSVARFGLVTGGFQGMAQAISDTIVGFLYPQVQSGIEAVMGIFDQLDVYLGDVAGSVLDTLYSIPEGFAEVMHEVVDYGTAIVKFFAQGIVQAASYVVQALQYIGNVITEWLQPHSPPKIVPELENWGKSAADIYFKGWTKADMSMFTDLSGMLEKAVGAIRPNGLSAAGTKRIRETIATAIQGYKQTGNLDESGLRDVGGRFNNEIISLTKAYISAASAANTLQKAQDELDTTTKSYDDRLAPLQDRLKAIQDTMSSFDITAQIKELQNVMANKFATTDQQAQAKAKLEELGIQKQINDLEADKKNRTADIQERVNAAKAENEAQQSNLDLLKERFQQEIDMIGLENKKTGGGGGSDSADKEKKGKKPKAPKDKPLINTDQPVLGELALPELPDAGLGGLGDILSKAKEDMKNVFGGVKDAVQPAIDAFNSLKDAALAAGAAFTSGFSGGDGGGLSGLKLFAFNVGTYFGAAWLAINGFITSVVGFAASFVAAFEMTPGSVGDKILGAINATIVTPAVQAFVDDLLLAPVGFTASFVNAFTIEKGSILEKIQAGLEATGVTAAINNFKLKVFDAIKEAFGGAGQGEHGRGGGVAGVGIDLSWIKQEIIDGVAAFDFKGKLNALKTNVKSALDALFGAGTGDAAESLVTDVTTKLDLLFGSVSFSDMKKSFDNLVTSVKDTIAGISWKEPLANIFGGLKDALLGALKVGIGLSKGDTAEMQTGMDQIGKGLGKATQGADELVGQIVDTILQKVNIGLIVAAIGYGLGNLISNALGSIDQILSKLTETKIGQDKQTIGVIVGKAIGEVIAGIVIGAIALVTPVAINGTIPLVTIETSLAKIVGDVIGGIVEGINVTVADLLKGKETQALALFATVRNSFYRMINAFVDALNAPANFVNEQRAKLPDSVKNLTPVAPLLDKIQIPILLTSENFKVINSAALDIKDMIKLGPDKLLLQSKDIVEINGEKKVLLDANAVLALDPDKRKTLPAGSLIEVDGKQKLAVDPKNIFKAPDGSVVITVDPQHVFKVKEDKPIDITVPVNAKLQADIKKATEDPNLNQIKVDAKPEISAENKLTSTDITGGTSTVTIGTTISVPTDQQVTPAKVTPDGTGKIYLPIVITPSLGDQSAGGASGGGAGGFGSSDEIKKIGTGVAQGVVAGTNSALADTSTGFWATMKKYVIDDPLAMLGIQSPSSVMDEKVGGPIGAGVVQGSNRALKEGGDLMAPVKTNFNSGYLVIKTVTDSFVTVMKQKYTAMKTDTAKIVTDMGTQLKKLFTDMKDDIIKIIQDMHDKLVDLFDDIASQAKSDFEAIKESGVSTFSKLRDDVVDLVQKMDKAIVDELATLQKKITDALQSVLDSLGAAGGIKDKYRNFGESMGTSFADGLVAGLKSVNTLSKVGAAAFDLGRYVRQKTDEGAAKNEPPVKQPGTTGPQSRSSIIDQLTQLSDIISANTSQTLGASLSSLLGLAQQGQVSTAGFATPHTNLVTPATVQKTYVLQMNVTPSQVEQVVTNFGIFEALAG